MCECWIRAGLYEPYEYNELDTCATGDGRRATSAFALHSTDVHIVDREKPSSSVRIRTSTIVCTNINKCDDFMYYITRNVDGCVMPEPDASCKMRYWLWRAGSCTLYKFYVMRGTAMDKMLSLMCLQCWRLCNDFRRAPIINANSFCYGFLYTHTLCVYTHTMPDTFTEITVARATFRLFQQNATNVRLQLHMHPAFDMYNKKLGIFLCLFSVLLLCIACTDSC